MVLTPAYLVSAALNEMPPHLRDIIEQHFFDNRSTWAIMKQCPMKKRQVEAALEMAVEIMRDFLRRRGVNGMADVI